MKYLLKKRELDNSSKHSQTRPIRQPARETSKKELLTLTPGNLSKGKMMKSVRVMMSEN
jgi:hypothetical protein